MIIPITTGGYWLIVKLNPEPWRVGPISPGRRGGKLTVSYGQDQQLSAYQEAIREAIGDQCEPLTGDVQVTIWLWRNRAEYKTPSQREHMKHDADATNMQKALEDALQGSLFANDKQVKDIHTMVVEQGPAVSEVIVVLVTPCKSKTQMIAMLPSGIRHHAIMVQNEHYHGADISEVWRG